jgi:hypothetical protein
VEDLKTTYIIVDVLIVSVIVGFMAAAVVGDILGFVVLIFVMAQIMAAIVMVLFVAGIGHGDASACQRDEEYELQSK